MEVVPCQRCSRCLNLIFTACVNMSLELDAVMGSPALSCGAQLLLGSPYLPKECLTDTNTCGPEGVSKCSSRGWSLSVHFQMWPGRRRSSSSATCQSTSWFRQSLASPGTPVVEVSCDPYPGVSLVELGSLMFTPCNTSVAGICVFWDCTHQHTFCSAWSKSCLLFLQVLVFISLILKLEQAANSVFSAKWKGWCMVFNCLEIFR